MNITGKLSTVLFAAAACTLGSCNGGKQAYLSEPLPTDNVVCQRKSGSNIECKITVDYPNGDDSLSHSVAAYINGQLELQYLPIQNDADNKAKYPAYSGTPADGNAVAQYYADGTIKYLKEMSNDFAGAEEVPKLTYELSVRKVADNDRYVSYETASYAFLGGAHGSATAHTANISKLSGKVLALTVDTLQAKAMQPILRKGVLDYLHEQGDTTATDSMLGDYLFIDNGIVPLPAHTPYLADDGVHFVYQQYEIGPYALGMVAFTVPYSDIKPYLTKEALGLLKKESE